MELIPSSFRLAAYVSTVNSRRLAIVLLLESAYEPHVPRYLRANTDLPMVTCTINALRAWRRSISSERLRACQRQA
jgi:hypothetical protein